MSDIPEGYMQDATGSLVPIAKIKPEHLEENDLVISLVAEAERLSRELADFKNRAFENVGAFRELVQEKYGAKKGGKKGNVTLSTFDGSLQVQVSVGENIGFGPELEAAKSLIDECVLRWSETSGDEVKALITHAFQTNKQGRIDTGRVLGLRRLEIDDPQWKLAMEAISNAVRVQGSKTYFRAYRVDPETEIKEPISLDLASA